MVDYVFLANFLTGVTLLVSSIGPLGMAFRVRVPRIRNLSYLLSAFLVVHAMHHLAWAFGYSWLSEEVLDPASVLAVIAFGIYLYQTTFPLKSPQTANLVAPAGVAAVGLFALPAAMGPDVTMFGLFAALAIYLMMVIKNPSIRSLQFQFAIFLGIWVLSEIVFAFGELGVNLGINPSTGIWLHFASMVALGVFVNYRFFGIRKGIKEISAQLQPHQGAIHS